MDIREIDRSDEQQVRAYWELGWDAVAERRYHTFPSWQASKAYVMTPNPDFDRRLFGAWDDQDLVGVVSIGAPNLDNTHLVWIDVAVRPERRRQGIGSRLLDTGTAWVKEQHRRLLSAEVFAPTDQDSPALEFARAHGFTAVLTDEMKAVDLAETRDRWPALAAEAAPYHRDYELRTSWAPVPDELMDGYCAINSMFVSEAPSGDADVEDEQWDEDRVRRNEERFERAGRRDVRTFALDSAGEVVALTEAFVNETMPHRGFQGGTLVIPAHRGHRLGLAVKVANQTALVERFPQTEWLVTGNADVNAPMNAINDRLGFRLVERLIEMQKAV